MPHRTPIKVRFYELDPYGHLNHAVYVNHFEVGRVECLESLGWGLDALQQQGNVVHQAATTMGATALFSLGTASIGQATANAGGGDDKASG